MLPCAISRLFVHTWFTLRARWYVCMLALLCSWQRLWETAALGPSERFQAISIQFALHYMFKTEETALNFFRSISDRLVAGGVLLITVPDANVLIRRIRNLPEGELEFGNDL